MSGIPNDYNPHGGMPRKPIGTRKPLVVVDPDAPAKITTRLVFGRRIIPPEKASLAPICPDECRMIEFGGCAGDCRLMAPADRKEPPWPTPTT